MKSNDELARELLKKGASAEKKQQFAEARVHYRSAGELGSLSGWASLGTLYLNGQGGSEDKSAAFDCFSKGAEGGHQRSQYMKAQMLEHGDGVTQDLHAAMKLYEILKDFLYKDSKQRYSELQERLAASASEKLPGKQTHNESYLETSIQLIPYEQLEFMRCIGEGAFGEVHKGRWQGETVAIKKLKMSPIAQRDLQEELKKEAGVLLRLNSPRVVRLFGISVNKEFAMVMEFVALGNLNTLLKKEDISWLVKLKKIGADISLGLGYLHDSGVIHRDLKAANILIDAKYRAKLGDFGIAKIKHGDNTTAMHVNPKVLGTTYWLAPEVTGANRVTHTKKSDIYSYGCILWELAMNSEPDHPLTLADLPDQGPSLLKQLMVQCWSIQPEDRPDAYSIAQTLAAYEPSDDETESTGLGDAEQGADGYVVAAEDASTDDDSAKSESPSRRRASLFYSNAELPAKYQGSSTAQYDPNLYESTGLN